jgi:hypothetical protein
MHIHLNPMANVPAGFHSVGAAEKAATAQRAAETRRNLLKHAARMNEDNEMLDAGELFMVGSWSEDRVRERHKQAPYRPQNDQPDEEQPGATPISVWA